MAYGNRSDAVFRIPTAAFGCVGDGSLVRVWAGASASAAAYADGPPAYINKEVEVGQNWPAAALDGVVMGAVSA